MTTLQKVSLTRQALRHNCHANHILTHLPPQARTTPILRALHQLDKSFTELIKLQTALIQELPKENHP